MDKYSFLFRIFDGLTNQKLPKFNTVFQTAATNKKT